MRRPLAAAVACTASLWILTACNAAPITPASSAALPTGCDAPIYHRLDFWLGSWDVVDPSGHYEGSSTISSTLHGCAIEERWTDARGHRGNGLFYVDRESGAWRQIWLTDEGPTKDKREIAAPIPNAIRFSGEVPTSRGPAIDRTTLTPLVDGRVRQVIEQSTDDGKTWSTWEGLYSRLPSACSAPNHRDFDFWVGDWSVKIHSRKTAESEEWIDSTGSNQITRHLGGCVIEERFLGTGGGSPTWNGRSWSMWIPSEKRWRQTWVDDSGSYLAFTGGLNNGEMILTGEPAADGHVMRMVFTGISASHILWRWEKTIDNGKTWRPMMRIDYDRVAR